MKNNFKSVKTGALLALLYISSAAQADTIANYMTIANNIPTMAMKPDQQSQSWVRSAQRILTSTDETMAQTVVAMNTVAAKQGHPVFCFPQGILFDGNTVHDIIQKTYAELVKTQGATVGSMAISEVLMLGMVSRYGCSPVPATASADIPAPAVDPLPAATSTTMNTLPATVPVSSSLDTTSALQMPLPAATTEPAAAYQPPPPASQTSPALPSDSMSNNPYGTPPTQQVVSADSPPVL